MIAITLDATDIINSAIDQWNSFYSQIIGFLTKSPEAMYPGAWEIAKQSYSYCKGIGMALLVIFFYVGLAKSYTDLTELRRPEKVFGIFVRFAFAKVLIDYTGTILTDLLDLSRSIVQALITNIGADTSSVSIAHVPKNVVDACNELGTIKGLLMDGISIIGWLAITGCSIVMLLSVIARFFRIYLYVAISPIPLASVGGQGTSHMARSFIRSFVGVCIQGIAIALSCLIFAGIATTTIKIANSDNAFTMMTNYLATLVLNMLILCGLVKGSDRVTREMIGV